MCKDIYRMIMIKVIKNNTKNEIHDLIATNFKILYSMGVTFMKLF